MEEFLQDQETIIQQLRLLLAAKEEELGAFRARQKGERAEKGAESLTDQLIKELEEKKREAGELRERTKEIEAKAKKKLSELAGALDEKEKLIASLQSAAPVHASGGTEEESAGAGPEREEWQKMVAALEEQLREKERLLAEASARAGEPAEEPRFREEIEALRERGAESAKAHEDTVAALRQEIESLRSGAGAPSLHEPNHDLKQQLEQSELSYRTAQAQLHRYRITQQVLQGACAALSVFLIFLFTIKTRSAIEARPETAAPREALSSDAPDSSTAITVGIPAAPPAQETGPAEEPRRLAAKPSAAATAENRIVYKVQKGDNLWLICQRQLGDARRMETVARDNNIADPKSLKVGDVIYLSRK